MADAILDKNACDNSTITSHDNIEYSPRAQLDSITKICKGDRLDLKYQYEISCQALSEYAAKGLTPSKLKKIQRHIPIVYPWNDGYQLFRNNYNRRWSYFPIGIIKCRHAKDVKRAIDFVREYKFEFSIRSGGHCSLAFSLSVSIIIDLSRMNKIKVVCNKESKCRATKVRGNKFVVVGPGAILGKVIKKISKYALSLPTGSCVNTGAGGLSCGGGISPSLVRLGGMTTDHLVSAKVLLANGKVVNANEKEHADLFFAIRGAGGCNFGIITEFTFHPCRFCGAIVFDIRYPWDLFSRVVEMWQNFAPFTCRRLSSELELFPPRFKAPENILPIRIKGQFEGSEKIFYKLMEPFVSLAKGKGSIIVKCVKTFAESGRFWGGTIQTYYQNASIFWYDKLSAQAIDTMATFLKNAPHAGAFIAFNAMLGAVADVPSCATAFPHRKALFWNLIEGTTLNPQFLPQQQIWVNRLYDALIRFAKKVAGTTPGYVNAPQQNLQKDDKYLYAYYANNIYRLVNIKNKYDPKNFFRFEQSIPLNLY